MDHQHLQYTLLIMLGAVTILLTFTVVLITGMYPPIKFIDKNTYLNYLNLKHQSELIFYAGVVDAYANFIARKPVCRSINIYRMLKDVIKYNSSEKFYLIMDDIHIRGYFNNTFYDFTAPSHQFYPSNTTIIECVLHDHGNHIVPDCDVVYADGVLLPGVEIQDLLENLFNETNN